MNEANGFSLTLVTAPDSHTISQVVSGTFKKKSFMLMNVLTACVTHNLF